MPDLFFADLVRETSTGTGTGALPLSGATPGHRRFADAVPPGARFHYAVAGVTHEGQWEVGEGEIAEGALVRDVVLASSDSGLVDFAAGLKTVTLTVAADWFAARDHRADHLHDMEQIDGLAEALAAKQPAGSYAPAVHSHDYLPRNAEGNWIAVEGRLGVGSLGPYSRLEVRGASMAGYSLEFSGPPGSLSGMQMYLGDGNFYHSGYWNSAPGIGAITDPTGVAGTLALAAYGGLAGERSLVAMASHNGYTGRALSPAPTAWCCWAGRNCAGRTSTLCRGRSTPRMRARKCGSAAWTRANVGQASTFWLSWGFSSGHRRSPPRAWTSRGDISAFARKALLRSWSVTGSTGDDTAGAVTTAGKTPKERTSVMASAPTNCACF